MGWGLGEEISSASFSELCMFTVRVAAWLQVWLYDFDLESLVYIVEKVCDGSGEDPFCSRWIIYPKNINFFHLQKNIFLSRTFMRFLRVKLYWNLFSGNGRLKSEAAAILFYKNDIFWLLTLVSSCRSVSGRSILDHLAYYGVELMAETWNSCKIVNDPRIEKYSTADSRGNLVLSKSPITSNIESRVATAAGRYSV